jgi:hypothetical protein
MFSILRLQMRCGAGGSSTTDEPKRANAAGSNPTSQAQDAQTTASGGAVVTFTRQVKRLCKAYQASGAAGLISKRRGQPSNHRLPEKTINKAQQLLRSRYHDLGPTLATEKLTIEGVS